ncbi:2-dehydro-3-deoxygalactonokinase [Noviherbaspirillum denitrificans]|uniref:2-dehydro-3-deoxygalactonokinase n=1 Tax=Noviherbaspirillum denitrificans TaxID=1968433 RepID=A0A254THN6_9BURK|nr:2-dehydro-3-deoxygalactonokinase [Noviherbaspirillum denitrificans]OWW22160.1 hypothetical protein AYR66_24360 [Noviherbaspirillum denitrificans]
MKGQSTALVGIDWGMTHRKVWILDPGGGLVRRHEDRMGTQLMTEGYEASLRALLEALEIDSADVILTGMAGGRNGWKDTPFLAIEHPLTRLDQAMVPIETAIRGTRLRVVPGYRYIDSHGLPDIMRGEETLVLGGCELGGSGGWFLLPEARSKWVHVSDGRITEFMTFMTGDLFSLLSNQGTLHAGDACKTTVPEAFASGLRAARQGGFTHMASSCDAMIACGMMPDSHAASFLSGLLIGAELFEMVKKAGDAFSEPVQVMGAPALASRYLNALELLGIPARAWQLDSAYVAALGVLFGLPAK